MVGYENGRAQVVCSKRLDGRKPIEATAQMPDGKKHEVTLTECEGPVEGVYACYVTPKPIAALIAEYFAQREGKRYIKVDAGPTHHFRVFAIRSKAIPNYKGITAWLSMEEAEMVVDGEMQVGQRLQVMLDLDDASKGTLTLDCEVTACKTGEGRKTFDVVIRWLNLDGDQRDLLEGHLQKLKKLGVPSGPGGPRRGVTNWDDG